jgi:hypothetical protein
MTTEEKAEKYHLMMIRIESYLAAYKDILIESQTSLISYQKLGMESMVELKKEHCDMFKGKIEILTDLKERAL